MVENIQNVAPPASRWQRRFLLRCSPLLAIVPMLLAATAVTPPAAHATGLQATVMSPIAGTVTSHPQEPHHRPYNGDYSFDVAAAGGDVYANFRNANGSLSLTVAGVQRACASRVFADGGDRITLNVLINGAKVGTVTYAHLTNLSYTTGAVPIGARLGRLATRADGLARSSCWTGPHVHVEPRNDVRYGCFIAGLQGRNIGAGQPLGIVGGERAGAVNRPCGASPETPTPGPAPANDPQGVVDDVSSPGPGLTRVRGWAFDRNDVAAALEIHAYAGGPAGTPGVGGHNLGAANASRPDVGAAFPGVGNNHGIDVTFQTRSGTFPVYVYAINRPGTPGGNVLLGTKNVTVANPDPIGALDMASSPQRGEIALSGWSADPNEPTAELGTHVYVGGPAGDPNAEFHNVGGAAVRRPDVAAFWPDAGSRHGYQVSFATAKSGTIPVYVYAINVGPGGNPLLGTKTVQVAAGVPRIQATSRPKLTGASRVGRRLVASRGAWSTAGLTMSYRWSRDGRLLRSATDSTYKLRRADRGHRIRVRVIASKAGYTKGTATSTPSRKVR